MKNATILATMFALAIGASAQGRTSKVPPAAHVPPVAHTASRTASSAAKTAPPSAIPGPRAVNGGKRK